MDKKIKVLTISDHPLSPSGVGTQTRYVIEALLKTGKFKFICLGGAMKHRDYRPAKTEEWGDDWTIFPVDGYGTEDIVRSVIRTERPDILWFMTDPRFYEWLWGMEHEIRSLIPMIYYHVWDNYPYPKYNDKFYKANDFIAAISKVTHDIVQTVSPEVDSEYVPHSVNTDIFKKLESRDELREQLLGEETENRFVIFWNNRNARRKMTGSIVFWYKEFLDKVGKNNATLVLHTDPSDVHGQDLGRIIKDLELETDQIKISSEKVAPEFLSSMYNAADLTINISDAEGFGLATLESLACETPIVVNMTGGLQEQVTDGKNWFGVGIQPSSKAVIGSQQVPYIYEDRVSKEDFIKALEDMYNLWKDKPEEFEKLGKLGRQHVQKNYNFESFNEKWVEIMLKLHKKHGSWANRKNYKTWELIEVKK